MEICQVRERSATLKHRPAPTASSSCPLSRLRDSETSSESNESVPKHAQEVKRAHERELACRGGFCPNT